ncbi:MAG: DUF1993 domain-containing protein [Pseudomonadales bacterium]
MAISLYDISVATYDQVLGGVTTFLEKGAAHCNENNIDLGDIVETRLYADMLPFRFQIVSVAHHSLGAIKGIEAGKFSPPDADSDLDYAGLQNLITETHNEIKTIQRETVEGFEGKEVLFQIGDRELPFTAENFVMSFSLPNLYFHAATAYDMLRMKGTPIGKRHYMGRLRMNMQDG